MQIDGIQNVYVVGDDIVESNAVSVFININGIAEVYVISGFLFAAKIHQDFIFNTSASISSEFGSFCIIKAGNRFDQTDGADGDQILLIPVCGVVFFEQRKQKENTYKFQ